MVKFTAEYKDKTYTFDFGYEAYIFHIALCNEFAYKICYREQGTTQYVRWFITRTYRKAKYVLRGCVRFPPTERVSNRPLVNPHWKIIPITNKEIKAGIWREIPF